MECYSLHLQTSTLCSIAPKTQEPNRDQTQKFYSDSMRFASTRRVRQLAENRRQFDAYKCKIDKK